MNARSIVNKLAHLHQLLYVDSVDLILITESFLHTGVSNGLLDPKNYYYVLRKDRTNGKGGGVCALVKRDITVLPVSLHECFTELEIVCFTVEKIIPRLRFFVVYRPPYYDQLAVNYMDTLTTCLSRYAVGPYVNVIVGDFNLPHIDWVTLSSPDDKIQRPFLDYCISTGYTQCVSFVTNSKNILDLVLCDYDQVIYNVSCVAPLGASDHAVVNFSVSVTEYHCGSEQCNSVLQYDWFSTDYSSMESLLVAVDWQHMLYNNPRALDFYCAFMQTLHDIILQCVPIKKKNRSRRPTKKPLPRALKLYKAKKHRLWRKLSACPYDLCVRNKYRVCCRRWNQLLRDREISIESNIIESNNLGAFYRHINNRITQRDNISVIVTDNDTLLTADIDKANEFNRYFSSVCVIDDGKGPVYDDKHPVDLAEGDADDDCVLLTSVTVNESDILRAINRMKNSLSCTDNLPPVLFKKLKNVLAFPLSLVFNQLLSVSAVPNDWKNAVIVPVLKKGFAGSVSNYRPISLTSVVSKLMERVITVKITDFLLQNNLLSDNQHGFLRHRSTCTNLLQCMNDWSLNIELGCQTVVVYVDFAKAFDTVCHSKLMYKLYSCGIRGSLLSWIKNFFSGRSHQTKVNGTLSDFTDLISGIVQGSGIGPILFIIFINDLIAALERYGVYCKLFADDLKLYLRVVDSCDINKLQLALDALVDWEKSWQLSVSPSKCCVLCIYVGKDSSALASPCLSIGDIQLPVVCSTLDLGVTITSDLTPRMHVKNIVAKAHMRANAIHRCFVSKDRSSLLRAFLVYVRPLLEYNSVVWSPYLKQDILSIENVQRRFTKRLRGLGDVAYADRLKHLGIPSLELRRLQFDLVFCYKIVFGLVNVKYDDFFKANLSSQTRGHAHKLYKSRCSSNTRRNFFAERVVNVWNALPNTVNFSSLPSFKRSIESVDFTDFLKCCMP